jgi:selenophosphate synthase
LDDLTRWRVLCDPQTSGGMLIAVDAGRVDALLEALATRGVEPAIVGRARAGARGRVTVL